MTSGPRPSVSFDRAADIYDATRALPDEIAAAVTEALLREIGAIDDGRVLEVGIGTGRIARPLAERGVRVCGVDISRRMMERLREQLTDRHLRPDLVLGDATRLPLADGSFGVALSFHVLHLVPDWEHAVEEVRRVLSPSGVFIHYLRRDEGAGTAISSARVRPGKGYAVWKDSVDKWDAMLLARGFMRRERPSVEEIGEKLESLGGSCRVEAVATEEERVTPQEMVEETRARTHSWSWEIPDELFAECLAEYEAWAQEGGLGPLDEPRVDTIEHELRVWGFG
jgi:SAM-dependent methyltransferase